MNNKIKSVNPSSLGVPKKSYSQGMLIPLGDAEILFVTGQIAQDAEGNVVAPNNAKIQTEIVFSRIANILKEGGMTMDNVVKTQIFLTNIKDSSIVSSVRDEVFKVSRPVSTLVGVSGLVKEGCCVEIEVTAIKIK
ncbi:MAG: RidA family protein [Patescibacteria group bacterium]|jgi:enamine deaminase RidA (YjgF/YER057c/UK114 family)